MKRLELEAYENCCILVSSTPVGQKKHDYFLHKDITITILDKVVDKQGNFIKISNPKYTQHKVEHLWVSPEVVKSGNIVNNFTKLFDKIFDLNKLHYLAKVEKYVRKNGTEDYGLTSVSKLEYCVYKILMFSVIHSSYLRTHTLSDFYSYYRSSLTTKPLSVSDLWNKLISHANNVWDEMNPYREYFNSFIDKYVDAQYFNNQFQSDMFVALQLFTAYFKKLEKVSVMIKAFEKNERPKIEKRNKKKEYKKVVKSRAKGFG